jgi:D-alanyl-D-alanine carboxypeptidase (penicillin-binding protein 5/6)
MVCRVLLTTALLAGLSPVPVRAQPAEKPLAPKAPTDPLEGPPFVTAKAWAVADGKTGKLLWGDHASEARPIASTTKILTAWVVLQLAADDAKVLDEVVVFSERADGTTGSSCRLQAGDKLPVRDLIYGMLLPSGNDAAVALAEHFGPRFAAGGQAAGDPVQQFVGEMNRRARGLGLKETTFVDPNGLGRNLSTAGELATLTWNAMQNARFREYVQTRRHQCAVVGPDGVKRTVSWDNIQRLLGIEGYDGVKTGTTTPAGSCLVASGHRGADHLIVVVLGSTSNDGRYADTRNLFRWAWRQRGQTGGSP